MKTKYVKVLTLLLVFLVQLTYAQNKMVSGTITDDSGLPLPGVNVIKKGSSSGTQSDFDGKYAVKVTPGDILHFSFVGFTNQEITISNQSIINIQMEQDTAELDEVVITSQGIKREKKAIGYAVSVVKSEQIENRPEADIARVLNGKVAGVSIVGTGGLAGSGTNFVIRGNSSINQNNQALFVVDGVPFNTASNTQGTDETGFINGTGATSSRFLDIDPNNIASLNVLKGLSATVLYGEAGRNGVILITTKNGGTQLKEKKFEATLNQSVFFSKISGLPDYQNTYGQGGDNSVNPGFVGNWGDRFDRNLTVRHPYNQQDFATIFPQFQGVNIPYQPFENNVKDFFRTGLGKSTSLNLSKSSEKASINASVGHTNEDGFVPGNNIQRLNFGLGGTMKLDNKFLITGSMNFSRTNFRTPPVAAANGTNAVSIFRRTLFVPRNLDLNGLPYQNPIDGSSVYYRTDQEHPNWLIDNSRFSQGVNRFFNSFSTIYSINDNLSLTYRFGLDTYSENQEYYINKGGVSSLQAQLGYLRTTSATNSIWDHSAILRLKAVDITEKIGLGGQVGINLRRDNYKQTGLVSTDQVVFNFIDHSNFASQTNDDPLGADLDFKTEKNVIGLYGQLQFDYEKYIYLTLAARNDWGSTVEKENQTLFYPSVNMSFVPTSAFPSLQSETLNFLKFRFGYGTSAGYPDPYLTRQTLELETAQFTPPNESAINTNSSNFIFPNADLRPELHREFELGLETNMWKNRITFDGSIYKRISKDQILNRDLDPSTGYTETFINAGEIENEGIEISLSIAPFKGNKGFQWNNQNIFTAYETTVIDLPDDIDQILYNGFSNIGNIAKEGEPLGAILGNFAIKDADGNFIINPNSGNIINSNTIGQDDKVIGDPNPDWKYTSINSFSYKGVNLSVQLEYTHGGDFYSTTIGNLLRRGVTKDTEQREGTFVIPGVLGDPATGIPLRDSSGNTIPNTIQQGANEIYFLNFVDPNDQQIFDASIFRIRELSLGYSVPQRFLENTPIGSISLSVFGQNVFFWAPNVPKYTNFDPETLSTGVGNGQGLDFQTTPNSRKFGFGMKLTF